MEVITQHFASTDNFIFRNPLTGEWYDFDDSSVSKMSNKSGLVT